MTISYSSKYIKIVVNFGENTTYIKVSDKSGFLLSSISENGHQLLEDMEDALKAINQKCARRWLRNKIHLYGNIRP